MSIEEKILIIIGILFMAAVSQKYGDK